MIITINTDKMARIIINVCCGDEFELYSFC